MASILYLGGIRRYCAKPLDFLQKKFLPEPFNRMTPGVHFCLDGPVKDALDRYGKLTIRDYITLRACSLLGLPNRRLETKLRAIGYAFLQEARLIEQRSKD